MKAGRITLLTLGCLAVALALGACGDNSDGNGLPTQCTPSECRVQAYTDMLALMKEAQTDPSLANAKFTAAEKLYIDTASLQLKVQGRTDDHLTDKDLVGTELDAAIMAGFAAGKAATGSELLVNLAKQKVDKTLIHFFFLSVYHEMVAGKRTNWDEALGYYGSKSDNVEGNRQGLAAVATKRDVNNGTSLEQEIFNAIIDGSGELAKALEAAGTEEVDWQTVPSLKAVIEDVDTKLQKVLAYSVGHEALGMQAAIDDVAGLDTDKMWVKAAELVHYYEPLGRLIKPSVHTQIDDKLSLIDFTTMDTAWMTTFATPTQTGGVTVPQLIKDLLEAEYSITIIK